MFGLDGKWVPVPVEYKKGKPKSSDIDKLQMVAQAVCPEEMLLCSIEKGYLYYGETRHRTEVVFTEELRTSLKNMTEEMHSYFEKKQTPKVKISKKCKECSLNEVCMPVLCKDISAKAYIKQRLNDGDVS